MSDRHAVSIEQRFESLLSRQGVIAGLTVKRLPGLAGAHVRTGAVPLLQGAQVL